MSFDITKLNIKDGDVLLLKSLDGDAISIEAMTSLKEHLAKAGFPRVLVIGIYAETMSLETLDDKDWEALVQRRQALRTQASQS